MSSDDEQWTRWRRWKAGEADPADRFYRTAGGFWKRTSQRPRRTVRVPKWQLEKVFRVAVLLILAVAAYRHLA